MSTKEPKMESIMFRKPNGKGTGLRLLPNIFFFGLVKVQKNILH